MRPMNNNKNKLNSNKNKLNSKNSWLFKPMPNTTINKLFYRVKFKLFMVDLVYL